MSLFKSCTRGSVYLTEEEEEEENNQPRNWLFSCCSLGRNNKKYQEGFIRLPEGGRHTIDDYLDPASPMTIETLLAEQEEELDNYLGQPSLDDSHGLFKRKYSLFVNNPILEEEEDAQYLSEHRISAILIDRPQLGSASLFQSEIISPQQQQQQDHFVIPEVSTSNRVFSIKTQAPNSIADAIYCDTPQDLNLPLHPTISSTTSTSTSTSTAAEAEHENYVLPVVGSSTSLSVFPATATRSTTTEFPATTLTRTPYQPIPLMHTHQQDIIPQSSMPTPIPPPSRRPSVVSAAQSLLGDKLDDFTEKLAFIKKNIIMSMDSDDDEQDEQELRENNHHYYDQKNMDVTANGDTEQGTSEGERRWDTFVLPKFNQKTATTTTTTTTAARPMNSNAVPLDVTPTTIKNMRRFSNASFSSSSSSFSSSSSEDFDFSKVVAISKNVRTFSEGVMGNGLRMFNNLSTRIKK